MFFSKNRDYFIFLQERGNKMITNKKEKTEPVLVNIIAQNTLIKGEMECKGDVRLEGSFEGSLKSEGKVVISETGRFRGDLFCNNADIAGYIDGDITVVGLLHLRSHAKLNANITTNKISIEEGAVFNGTCTMNKQSSKENNINKQNLAAVSHT